MINKVILIGNVGADPVIRCFENGNSVAKFRLVTTERYKDKEGNTRELNEWHNVETWNQPAKIIDLYVRKGDRLYVEGNLHYEEYTGNDNVKRTQTIIRLQVVKLLTPRAKEEQPQQTVAQTPVQTTPPQVQAVRNTEPPQIPMPPIEDVDDLPFG